MWTDVFEIECSVKFSRPAYPLLAAFRGVPIICLATWPGGSTMLLADFKTLTLMD
jgi:hypothetical protein